MFVKFHPNELFQLIASQSKVLCIHSASKQQSPSTFHWPNSDGVCCIVNSCYSTCFGILLWSHWSSITSSLSISVDIIWIIDKLIKQNILLCLSNNTCLILSSSIHLIRTSRNSIGAREISRLDNLSHINKLDRFFNAYSGVFPIRISDN